MLLHISLFAITLLLSLILLSLNIDFITDLVRMHFDLRVITGSLGCHWSADEPFQPLCENVMKVAQEWDCSEMNHVNTICRWIWREWSTTPTRWYRGEAQRNGTCTQETRPPIVGHWLTTSTNEHYGAVNVYWLGCSAGRTAWGSHHRHVAVAGTNGGNLWGLWNEVMAPALSMRIQYQITNGIRNGSEQMHWTGMVRNGIEWTMIRIIGLRIMSSTITVIIVTDNGQCH